LTDALLVNPYAIDDFAEAIRKAIEMPREEKQAKMRKLRQVAQQNNIYQWASNIIAEMANLGIQ
jgi:trehalose-6-phosphate synthase